MSYGLIFILPTAKIDHFCACFLSSKSLKSHPQIRPWFPASHPLKSFKFSNNGLLTRNLTPAKISHLLSNNYLLFILETDRISPFARISTCFHLSHLLKSPALTTYTIMTFFAAANIHHIQQHRSSFLLLSLTSPALPLSPSASRNAYSPRVS